MSEKNSTIGTIKHFSTKTGGIKFEEQSDKWYNAENKYKAELINKDFSPGDKIRLLLNDEGFVVQAETITANYKQDGLDKSERIELLACLKCAAIFLNGNKELLPMDLAAFAKDLKRELFK